MLWTQPAYLRPNTNHRTFGNVPHVLPEKSSLGAMSLSPTLRATRKGTTSRGTSRSLPRRFLSSLPVAFVREECEGAPSYISHTSFCPHLNLRSCLFTEQFCSSGDRQHRPHSATVAWEGRLSTQRWRFAPPCGVLEYQPLGDNKKKKKVHDGGDKSIGHIRGTCSVCIPRKLKASLLYAQNMIFNFRT